MNAIVVAALLAWWLFAGAPQGSDDEDDDSIVSDLLNTITRGARLTNASYDHATGVVSADPAELAAQMGATLDECALARMLSSEEGRSDNTTKAAVAWVACNNAQHSGKSVAALLLHATEPAHSGRFGTFKNIDKSSPRYGEDSHGRPNVADRYASTALDPYEGDLDLARAVLNGSIADMTSGAIQFDRPAGETNPDAVAAKRYAAGRTLVEVPGADPGLRFWA